MSAWVMSDKILPILLVVVGFVARSAWDIITKRRESLRDLQLKSQVARLETQLSEFYWPIYLRLIQNEATWEHLLNSTLGKAFEKSILLPNHEAIVARLQTWDHLADINLANQRLAAVVAALAGLAVKLFHSILQSTTGGLFGPPVSLPTPYFGTP